MSEKSRQRNRKSRWSENIGKISWDGLTHHDDFVITSYFSQDPSGDGEDTLIDSSPQPITHRDEFSPTITPLLPIDVFTAPHVENAQAI